MDEAELDRLNATLQRTCGRWAGATLAVAAMGAALASAPATPALAQALQLPGIIVEGATLERPPARLPQPGVPAEPVTTLPPPPQQQQPLPPAGTPIALPPVGPAGQPGPGQTAVQPGVGLATGEMAQGVPIAELGSAVSVVTGEELRAQQIRHAADALRALPGVTVNQTSTPASLTQVRIRGAEGNHTLVMIDGVVANDATNGEFDFSNLSAADIERIEVIRGPQSVIYGTGAIGGAINIITRSGRGPAQVRIQTEGGSFGTRDLALGLSGGTAQAWGSISYHARHSDGFNIAPVGNERDASRLESFALRGGVQLMPGLTIDGSLRNVRKGGDRDGFGGPAGQLATAVDNPSHFSNEVLLANLRARWEMPGGWFTHELKTTYNSTNLRDTDLSFPGFPFVFRYEGETRSYSYVGTMRLPAGEPALFRHSITGLAEWNEDTFRPLGDFADGIRRSRERLSFAAEWRGSIANQLHLSAGVRTDDTDAFGTFNTWRTAASWVMGTSGFRLHASAGTGFKAPTLFEQFGSIPAFFLPNPNLKPEESFGWDVGLEWTSADRRFIADVTYFDADLTNKIATVGFPSTPVNLPGRSTREGVEVSARYLVVPGVTVGGAYTYLDARNPTGEREPRRPPHAGRLDVDARFLDGRARVNLAAIYNGRMNDLGFRMPFFTQEIVHLDPFWRVTLAASYKLTDQIELFGRIENLFDQRIQEVYGYNHPGIAAFGGVRITLGGEERPAFAPGLK